MINFLTSNAKKAEDFITFGFGVKEFDKEIIEIKSPDVEIVALHKARDTQLNNIVVEDTSLYVEDSHFWGTDIKHVYEEIKDDPMYDNHKAIWKICLCAKINNNFYLSSGELNGVLKYPPTEDGYHFEKFFSVKKNNDFVHYSSLSKEEKAEISPRFKALRKLQHALNNNDFSHLIKIPVESVKDWDGEYQIEKEKNIPKKIKFK